MRTLLFLLTLLTTISATALTYRLEAHEKACFFAHTEHKGTKLAFYFAVQSGGSFDVDYSVVGPADKLILDGTKERQGDFVFTANEAGEYKFCFGNEMSTFAEKMVDFEIAVRPSPNPFVHGEQRGRSLTTSPHRSKTKPPVPSSPPNKAPPPNKPPSSKNLSSSSAPNYPPSPATKSTSARARIATSALLRVLRGVYSSSVLWRVGLF